MKQQSKRSTLNVRIGLGVWCASGMLLGGCGGGKKDTLAPRATATTARGRATLSVKWPERRAKRLIPDLSNSLRIEILRSGEVFDFRVIARPDDVSTPTVVTFDSLPVGNLQLRATAYPNTDGTGVGQATGTAPLIITAGQVYNFGMLEMVSEIATFTVEPAAAETLEVGALPQQWTVTARNASGAVVLTSPEHQQWASSDVSVAVVDAGAGLVTILKAGEFTIICTDTESGKSGSASVTVNEAPIKNGAPIKPGAVGGTVDNTGGNGFVATDGGTYEVDTSAASHPVITDGNGAVIAHGQYVTQVVGEESRSVEYAVFDFAVGIHLGGGSKITSKGGRALILLSQGNVLLDGGATVDISASGTTPGVGGYPAHSGPGAGKRSTILVPDLLGLGRPVRATAYGGGGFGGAGGYSSGTYELTLADAPSPYLQGGSGGYTSGAGGGALYIAASGTLTLSDAGIQARGGDGGTGGSGGAIVLVGAQGTAFTQATIDTGGGKATSSGYYGGGGGGHILIGYPTGTAVPDTSGASATGGTGRSAGKPGKVSTLVFAGF